MCVPAPPRAVPGESYPRGLGGAHHCELTEGAACRVFQTERGYCLWEHGIHYGMQGKEDLGISRLIMGCLIIFLGERTLSGEDVSI